MSHSVKLSIIICALDSRDHLVRCFESLSLQYLPRSWELILVENGSSDGTAGWVAAEYPQFRVIANTANKGVSIARNQALAEARGEFVLFLDADTYFTESHTIKHLISVLDSDPTIALLAPKLLYPDGRYQCNVRRFPTLSTMAVRALGLDLWAKKRRFFRDFLYEDIMIENKELLDVDWALAACQLIRSSVFNQIGLLDPKYFYGYEDIDFCYRLKRGGARVVFDPRVSLVHIYQRRSTQSCFFAYHHGRSILRFLVKRYLCLI
ncbi:MAG: glycosyltransferase [Parcubacteria group bacterium Gr01-1014_18]|nr:MAG: glycosyltransferase [Parcubacteria group bacterium Greene0416_36]TSC81129.1 MAG: glycosyltransferase [Parcubacteria group bacterium Gr01-1014_18]TSC98454.1 MAG: glycosyltransferase [Parcubacteria group bacterium Greene1014_20]TSD07380.1 MAG: glycosyltransferase [Parcubacteria group bacterium Greene0714_2]